jgi:hypothetical protein
MRVNTYLIVTGIIFAVLVLMHALRLMNAWPVTIGTLQIPIVWSWVGLVVAGALCAWAVALFRERK